MFCVSVKGVAVASMTETDGPGETKSSVSHEVRGKDGGMEGREEGEGERGKESMKGKVWKKGGGEGGGDQLFFSLPQKRSILFNSTGRLCQMCVRHMREKTRIFIL